MATSASPVVHSDVPLDHVIFYAGQALDALASIFERAGFTLTPLGRHSSGSVNRLAILERQYLELIGFEPGTPATVRPELQSLPLGLSGIALADREDRAGHSGSEAFMPSRRLERPVAMPGVQGLAAFTTTELRHPVPDVRVFLCRHHTPQLVWHPAWQRHANGALAASDMGLHTRDAPGLHAALRTVLDLDPAQEGTVYDAAGTRLRIAAAGERASITLRTHDLDAVRRVLAASGLPHAAGEGRVSVPLPAPYAAEIVFT
ncbi:VOC family protein [Ramlibacter sp. AN1133]|uniref:VOC family protein n=1 Tax=Ramlibacter sp. AN1133 TaxID=3133429 RepID=UPI0030BC4414